MTTAETIKSRIETAFAGARVELVPNGAPSAQGSLLVEPERAREIAGFLRDDPSLRFDYASNVTGVDWPESVVKDKVKRIVDGVEREEIVERKTGGYLEAVYHLYSMERKDGPVVIRLRTRDRATGAALPSLTPIWRSCEFQEREIYDLFGVTFDGHPDLRRLLMWDGFADHPMRKDYVAAEDAP